MAVPEHHIREAVARYVSGEIGRRELQEWFAPVAWELLTEGSSPPADLAAELELVFAESTSEGWTENELRDKLVDVASIPLGRLFHIESPLDVAATGGPLQNTVMAHQATFWFKITTEEAERAA